MITAFMSVELEDVLTGKGKIKFYLRDEETGKALKEAYEKSYKNIWPVTESFSAENKAEYKGKKEDVIKKLKAKGYKGIALK